ncbi:ABC transporter permease [Pelagibacterium lentulum]|uniref:Peptide ABC transporter permease n=1 Tax=Pelagibacterium lentulum TaxID=2029865 RepID=A0A916RAH7_9HYPH|nr:ABC transporter permease [Pelagibacterium lentulum]GGA49845.1 peptide ABC transporter permease [Pelagibacterium lentulum]
MISYLIRRLLGTIPIVLIVGAIAFFLVQLSPGDPAMFYVSADAPPSEIERVRERLGLDQPIATRFVYWFGQVLQGDLGVSFHQNRPVLEGFLAALPVTLWLAFFSLVIAIAIGIPVGLFSALRPNGMVDKFATVFVFVGVSMPNFWLGMLLVLMFAVTLGWMPAQGFNTANPWEAFRSLVLPAITLGYSQAALIARMTRASMLEVMRQDYVQTARAKGLRVPVVLGKHAFGNALNPIVTIIGLAVGSLAAGSAVVEVVFNLPGIGRLVVDSVMRRDYPMIQGILLLTAGMIIVVNLITDLLYAVLDPRIRYD